VCVLCAHLTTATSHSRAPSPSAAIHPPLPPPSASAISGGPQHARRAAWDASRPQRCNGVSLAHNTALYHVPHHSRQDSLHPTSQRHVEQRLTLFNCVLLCSILLYSVILASLVVYVPLRTPCSTMLPHASHATLATMPLMPLLPPSSQPTPPPSLTTTATTTPHQHHHHLHPTPTCPSQLPYFPLSCDLCEAVFGMTSEVTRGRWQCEYCGTVKAVSAEEVCDARSVPLSVPLSVPRCFTMSTLFHSVLLPSNPFHSVLLVLALFSSCAISDTLFHSLPICSTPFQSAPLCSTPFQSVPRYSSPFLPFSAPFHRLPLSFTLFTIFLLSYMYAQVYVLSYILLHSLPSISPPFSQSFCSLPNYCHDPLFRCPELSTREHRPSSLVLGGMAVEGHHSTLAQSSVWTW
jgi:hypothetical protein